MKNITLTIIMLAFLASGCSRSDSYADGDAEVSADSVAVEQPVEAFDGGVREEAYYLSRFPEVATRSGETLTLRLASGRTLTFVDNPETGEEYRSNEFRGVIPGKPFALVMQGFLEGGFYSLVHLGTGEETRLDNPPVFSPDGQWLFSTSVDLEAGFFPNRVAIHRVTSTGAPLVWEMEDYMMEWGPEDTRWVDNQTLTYTKVSRVFQDDGTELRDRTPQTVRLVNGEWVQE